MFAYTVTDASGSQSRVTNQRPTRLESRKIVFKATPKSQKIYNRLRANSNKDQLRAYVTSSTESSRLHPPQTPGAPSVSDDGELSPSPTQSVYSDGPVSSAYAVAQRAGVSLSRSTADDSKLRGRRKKPLKPDTKFHAAVKRALRLVCEKHRTKKTTVSTGALSRTLESIAKTAFVVHLS